MTRAILATTLTGAALIAGAYGAGMATASPIIPAIANESASHGWPHHITRRETRDLTNAVRRDITRWIGTSPRAGRCSFTACGFRWSSGAIIGIRLKVWEDGSYRLVRITGAVPE